MAILSQHRQSGMTGGWIVVLAVLASVAGAQQFRMDDRTIRVAQDFRIAGETETVLSDIRALPEIRASPASPTRTMNPSKALSACSRN